MGCIRRCSVSFDVATQLSQFQESGCWTDLSVVKHSSFALMSINCTLKQCLKSGIQLYKYYRLTLQLKSLLLYYTSSFKLHEEKVSFSTTDSIVPYTSRLQKVILVIRGEGKFVLEQVIKAQTGNGGAALLFP